MPHALSIAAILGSNLSLSPTTADAWETRTLMKPPMNSLYLHIYLYIYLSIYFLAVALFLLP